MLDMHEYTLKFVLVGSAGVGKSQLVLRFVRHSFTDESFPTIGMEFATKALQYGDNCRIRAQIWDTAGHDRFRSMTEAYYRGTVGAMLVYDITDRNTFDALDGWLKQIRENCHRNIVLCLVGNKSDRSAKEREVSMVEGMKFAQKHSMDFCEVSAKNNVNVGPVLRHLIMSMAKHLPKHASIWGKEKKDPLPDGWVTVFEGVRRGLPGGEGTTYENTWTGERVSKRPTLPAGLPPGSGIVHRQPQSNILGKGSLKVGGRGPFSFYSSLNVLPSPSEGGWRGKEKGGSSGKGSLSPTRTKRKGMLLGVRSLSCLYECIYS
ncbi:unnamed protein product [Discosporangium mesarthrocarpum]